MAADDSSGRSGVVRAGTSTGVEAAGCGTASPAHEAASVVSPLRRVMRSVLRGFLAVLLVVVGGVSGWLWWTRPPVREVPLPDGVAAGEVWQIGVSVEPATTEAGTLTEGPLRSERHEWIGSLKWARSDGVVETFELRLGDTVHIDGLGTVTLLRVMPEPLLPDYRAGFWTYTVNVTLDPGVELIG